MLKRQDRQGVRSPADIERKYNQFANKVETDANGKLKSRVHVTGSEFTVDTKNFKLDEKGNVSITGDFATKNETGTLETKISAGLIFVDGLSVANNGDESRRYLLLAFNANGKTMGLYADGYINNNNNFVFQRLTVESITPEPGGDI